VKQPLPALIPERDSRHRGRDRAVPTIQLDLAPSVVTIVDRLTPLPPSSNDLLAGNEQSKWKKIVHADPAVALLLLFADGTPVSALGRWILKLWDPTTACTYRCRASDASQTTLTGELVWGSCANGSSRSSRRLLRKIVAVVPR